MNETVTQLSFLNDVIRHEMIIVADTEDFKHIRFSQPDSDNCHFDITTWADHLCISGDIGTYVFQRVYDIFETFHNDKMRVNYSYWGQKLEAISKYGGYREFDSELVSQSIKERVNSICDDIEGYFDCASEEEREEYPTPELMSAAFREEVKDHFMWEDLGEYRFISAIESFESSVAECLKLVDDDWDWMTTEKLSYQYQWCCHAIVWAIKQYNRSKSPIVICSYYQPVV